MSLYIKGRKVEAMFMYDGDLIDSNGAFYVPVWAERLYKEGYLFYAANLESPSELFYKSKEDNIHVPVGSYVYKRADMDSLVIVTEEQLTKDIDEKHSVEYYMNENKSFKEALKIAESRIDTLKKINSDLTDRLRKYEWNHEMMKRMIEGAIK